MFFNFLVLIGNNLISVISFLIIGLILFFYNFVFKSNFHHDIYLNSIFNILFSVTLILSFFDLPLNETLYIITFQSSIVYFVSSFRKLIYLDISSSKLVDYIIRKEFLFLKSVSPILFNLSIIFSQIILGFTLLFSKYSLLIFCYSLLFHFFSIYLTNRGRCFHLLLPLSFVFLSYIDGTSSLITTCMFCIYLILLLYFIFSKRFSLFIKSLCTL